MYPNRQITPSTESASNSIRSAFDHAVLDVGDPELGAAATRRLQHRRGEVAADQAALLADQGGRLEARVADPAGELEQRVAQLRRELADQPLAHGRRDALDIRAPALPGRRDRLRDLVAGAAVGVDRLTGHHAVLTCSWPDLPALERLPALTVSTL
ncbi:MAG: hypothetical protein KY453_12945 [Gemmatimonadetes bacterium]|nr:hypothetical protein [Gemmatimonadota bacterium]